MLMHLDQFLASSKDSINNSFNKFLFIVYYIPIVTKGRQDPCSLEFYNLVVRSHAVNNKQMDFSSVINAREKKKKQCHTNEYNSSWEEVKGSDSLNKTVKEGFSEMRLCEVTPEGEKAQPHEGLEEKHSRERDKCRGLMLEGVSGAKRAED